MRLSALPWGPLPCQQRVAALDTTAAAHARPRSTPGHRRPRALQLLTTMTMHLNGQRVDSRGAVMQGSVQPSRPTSRWRNSWQDNKSPTGLGAALGRSVVRSGVVIVAVVIAIISKGIDVIVVVVCTCNGKAWAPRVKVERRITATAAQSCSAQSLAPSTSYRTFLWRDCSPETHHKSTVLGDETSNDRRSVQKLPHHDAPKRSRIRSGAKAAFLKW